MFFGVDYYPEHWPEEWWQESAGLMKEAGINIVRLAEFAWTKMEPAEGNYDFSWLDRAINLLFENGIKVVLGTPTATPPKWLTDKAPDIFMKDKYGLARGFGSRRHYCYNNPVYHEYTEKIASKMAEHYKDHPAVVAWQIDNEFGCHNTTRCYCGHCLEAFKEWLKNKYSSPEQLNAEWGTVFWSQQYGSWDELILPGYAACDGAKCDCTHDGDSGHNPGLVLDFKRFSSDSVVKYQRLQTDTIRKYSAQPLTHNMMGHFSEIDYFELGKDLDFVSWDNYPLNTWSPLSYTNTAMAHEIMRGVKNQNFWVMEQQSGPCGWWKLGDTPKPGQMRLWTYQAVAHGAEAIVYFRWRTCTFGAEEYWYGVLDHDGIPRRRYKEIQQTGKELQALADYFVGSEAVNEAAIVKSYDNCWSHEYQPHNESFNYNGILSGYYSALAKSNINAGIISADADFSEYKLVLMPAFNLMTKEIQSKATEYVNNGGSLVITYRSGTRNWNNSMTTETLPGYFKELAGIEITEFDSLNGGRSVKSRGITGEGTSTSWCDIIKPESAEVISSYTSEFYQGEAAVTVNTYGKGKVYYIGCDLLEAELAWLLKHISGEAGIKPLLTAAFNGLEAVKRIKDGKEYLMLLNHNSLPVTLDLGQSYEELISGGETGSLFTMQPYEVAMLYSR